MYLSRIRIEKFRNFRDLDVALGGNVVIVGENRVGKSNLLFGLRLIFDPSLPDSSRQLGLSDFWDGLEEITSETIMTVSVEIKDFEDDPDVRRVVRRSLLDLGFAVIEAAHAQEAQDILVQMPDIKLLLSDIMMPGEMNGVGLARLARLQRPTMQILLMSGCAPSGDELMDLPVLPKPFSTRDLAAALEGLTP